LTSLYRVFHRGLSGVRKLYPADDSFIDQALGIIEKNKDADYYESIYLYNQSHLETLEKTKTLAGIEDVTTDRVVFDFDSKDIGRAKLDAIILVQALARSVIFEKCIRIFYSGSKGFHVEVHLNSRINRSQFENIVQHYAGHLPTFDHKIKDQQRLFRFPLTRHSKSKRYKIPLTYQQLESLSMEEIEKLSLNPVHDSFYEILNSYETIDMPEAFKSAMVAKVPEKKEKTVSTEVLSDRPDMSRKPRHLTPAKFALQEGFFQDGERNEACMILASTYKYLGYNERHTYNILKGTLALRAERLGHEGYDKGELYNTIIKPVYSPLWKGGTFSEDEGLLKLTSERYDLNKADVGDVHLVDLNSLSSQFLDFATNIDANTIKLGIDEIDKKLRMTTSSLVALLAAPSAGKSSVSFGILNTLSKSGEKAMFFSMDMSIPQVYQRIIQRHTGDNEDVIMNNYKNGRTAAIEHYQNLLSEEYQNVKFCFRSGMTVPEVRATLKQHELTTGALPRLTILDYLECMKAEGVSDSAQSKAQIATELKGLANELGICIILLVQPRMMAGGPAGELNSYTDIKGSSVISEAAAQVITISRPGFSPKNPEDDNYMTINVVKNRMGKLSSTDLHWDGLTGHIRSLSGEEENDLKALRAAIAQEKTAKDDTGSMY
jgi:DnaB-like helicase C terminal domain